MDPLDNVDVGRRVIPVDGNCTRDVWTRSPQASCGEEENGDWRRQVVEQA